MHMHSSIKKKLEQKEQLIQKKAEELQALTQRINALKSRDQSIDTGYKSYQRQTEYNQKFFSVSRRKKAKRNSIGTGKNFPLL